MNEVPVSRLVEVLIDVNDMIVNNIHKSVDRDCKDFNRNSLLVFSAINFFF